MNSKYLPILWFFGVVPSLSLAQTNFAQSTLPDEQKFTDCYHAVMQSGGPDAAIPQPQPAAAYRILHMGSKDDSGHPTYTKDLMAIMPAGAHESAEAPWRNVAAVQGGRQLFFQWFVEGRALGLDNITFSKVELGYRFIFHSETGNPIHSSDEYLTLTDSRETTLYVPDEAEMLTYWFRLTTKETGVTLYDSQQGANYKIPVLPNHKPDALVSDQERTDRVPLLCFYRAWNQSHSTWLTGYAKPLQAGSLFYIAYDVNRLKDHLNGTWHDNVPSWDVFAYAQFLNDHNEIIGQKLKMPITYDRSRIHDDGSRSALEHGTVMLPVYIPMTARKVQLWFSGNSYGGSHQPGSFGGTAWDSNFSQNWNFPVYP